MYIAIHKRTKLFLQSALLATLIVSLVGGIAFGILRSQTGEVQGNTISTANASLLLSRDGTQYDQTIEGFNFDNIIPGDQPSPAEGHQVFVKNVGSAPLQLTLSVDTAIENLSGIDLQKVHIIVTPVNGGNIHNFSLMELTEASQLNAGRPIDQAHRLLPGQVYSVKFQVSLDLDAVSGSAAQIRNIVFKFDGTSV